MQEPEEGSSSQRATQVVLYYDRVVALAMIPSAVHLTFKPEDWQNAAGPHPTTVELLPSPLPGCATLMSGTGTGTGRAAGVSDVCAYEYV